jgi:hypothetical protein
MSAAAKRDADVQIGMGGRLFALTRTPLKCIVKKALCIWRT